MKLMDPKLIIAIIPAGGARFPKQRGEATPPHAAGEASDDGVLLLRADCGRGDRGANSGAGGGGPGVLMGRRRRLAGPPGSGGAAAGRGGGWSKSSLKMLKEREGEEMEWMLWSLEGRKKWREGVICHSATTIAAAAFSRG